MKKPNKRTGRLILSFEILIFLVIAYFARQWLDGYLSTLVISNLIATVIRLLFFVSILAIAFLVDKFLHRYLKSKGMVE